MYGGRLAVSTGDAVSLLCLYAREQGSCPNVALTQANEIRGVVLFGSASTALD